MGKKEESKEDENKDKDKKDDKDKKEPNDIFRYPLVRFLGGYLPEVTNDLASISPLVYGQSCWLYKIRPTYILFDTLNKGVKAYQDDKGNGIGPGLLAAGDRYLWHIFASILLPSISLNYLRRGLSRLLGTINLTKDMKTSLITIAVLGAIPLIIQPLDEVADHILENSYRKIYMGKDNKEESKKEEKQDNAA
ncbi:mitochondrial fission process protein 1-like [Chrysoperla carnea]|uniref:mitochondrial fission process protein 1-like n=1 Tax=Chrysoperla carnea TaxID=189513 RepID=UPI001D0606E9|nr:mitochondrial fission process protein 1-like [Chrysoperla carnea]